MGKEITLLKEKLQKKAEKVVSDFPCIERAQYLSVKHFRDKISLICEHGWKFLGYLVFKYNCQDISRRSILSSDMLF